MAKIKTENSIDRIIIILFYISITISLYTSSLSQTTGDESMTVSRYVLLIPFGVAFLQLIRIALLCGRYRFNSLSRSWIFIFIYYLISFLGGQLSNEGAYGYYSIWFMVCPPVAWLYFSILVKVYPSLIDYLIKLNFWFLIVFSLISLYFIPRSIRSNGLFSSLNTCYYVLFAYPMAMMNNSKLKKTISTILLLIIVLLSLKRGGYVSVVLAISLYFVFASKTSIIRKILLIAICVGAIFYLIPKIDALTNGTLMTRYEFSRSGGDEEGRLSMYTKVWEAVWSSGYTEQVLGHGLNAVVTDNILSGEAAHNDYLEFLYDFGLVGLFLLLFYQWQLLVITLRSHKNSLYFFSTIFAFSSIIVLSMVSIVYAYYYFLVIIPFWCVMHQIQIGK